MIEIGDRIRVINYGVPLPPHRLGVEPAALRPGDVGEGDDSDSTIVADDDYGTVTQISYFYHVQIERTNKEALLRWDEIEVVEKNKLADNSPKED